MSAHDALSNHAQRTESQGSRLVSLDGRTLPLRDAALDASARGGLARARLRQRFVNPHAEPLAVTYVFPLPHDGAVSAYAFELGDRRIEGRIEKRDAARAQYEEAIVLGRTAALLEETRGSVFQQELGNVPAGAEVVVELSIDQRLHFREGAWEWRFPTVVAPRYVGAEGRVPDAPSLALEVVDGALADERGKVSCALALRIDDALAEGASPASPSHALRVDTLGCGASVAFAASDGVALDRDVVVRWSVAGARIAPALELGEHGGERFGLVTLVPPQAVATTELVARDLVLLLDTSGSMMGAPLQQAKAIARALVLGLGAADTLEMVEFSSAPRRFARGPLAMDERTRRKALGFIDALEAGGGTEMVSGILEALAPRRAEAQRQVVVVTDGQIGFEDEVLRTAATRLDGRTRVHVVGVGEAVNRSLTAPLARAGRGAELIVGLGDDAARAALELRARTERPLCVEVALEGSALLELGPRRVPDLLGGAPALVPCRLARDGGELLVRGRLASGAEWTERLVVPPTALAAAEGSVSRGAAIAAFFAREAVEDLELARALEPGSATSIDGRIEALGLRHRIATRRTSWIAITEEKTVDPTRPSRRTTMPVALPHGQSAVGLGLRPAGSPILSRMAQPLAMAPPSPMPFAARVASAAPQAKSGGLGGVMRALFGGGRAKHADVAMDAAPPEVPAAELNFEEPTEGLASVPTTGAPLPTRKERGRRRRLSDGRVVIEVELSAPLRWRRPATVIVTTVDGAEVTVRLDLSSSTADASLDAGIVLRLVLEDGEPARRGLVRVLVEAHDALLEIELEGSDGR